MSLAWTTTLRVIWTSVGLIVNMCRRSAYHPFLLDRKVLTVFLELSLDLRDVVCRSRVTSQ